MTRTGCAQGPSTVHLAFRIIGRYPESPLCTVAWTRWRRPRAGPGHQPVRLNGDGPHRNRVAGCGPFLLAESQGGSAPRTSDREKRRLLWSFDSLCSFGLPVQIAGNTQKAVREPQFQVCIGSQARSTAASEARSSRLSLPVESERESYAFLATVALLDRPILKRTSVPIPVPDRLRHISLPLLQRRALASRQHVGLRTRTSRRPSQTSRVSQGIIERACDSAWLSSWAQRKCLCGRR